MPPAGEQAGPRLEHSSRCMAFTPGHSSARGCIWSFYFPVWVGYSQCPNIRKKKGSIKSKAPLAKPRAELAPPKAGSSTCATRPQPHRPCQRLVKCPFQMQENFKGKALPRASKAGSSLGHSSSPLKSPTASSFLFPMSRFSLQNTTSKEPGHPTPSRHLQSLLQKAELVWSEPSGRHKQLFHPASPQLFYPSTFKNNGAIQLFKTKVVCFFLW